MLAGHEQTCIRRRNMKRISLVLAFSVLVVMMTAGGAFAWTLCFQDTLYTPQYQVDVQGGLIRGQAVLEQVGFPAPITGTISSGTATFSIAYRGDNGLRFYIIDIFTGTGTTWGLWDEDATFYDSPHAAQLISCGTATADGAGTGAAR
jgi:hypothetical protein